MTTETVRETAKIYEFPIRSQRRLDDMRTREIAGRPVIYESCAGSWYHEDAIREADKTRKQ
ncbi:DUF2735 domain-containing protein [Rhizobium halophytocola]|uniref:DUF2735 domain-containing protein n=1 Tax=Rhizobium halophytocola TaxID=735519 RepID=A0ABS4DSE3_9HYPH|nr:DUF2735 domain-containing protein [Rhizobium halophytocola]MBP1848605.1 hypothetical protein [Rhizobium halophytocola]